MTLLLAAFAITPSRLPAYPALDFSSGGEPPIAPAAPRLIDDTHRAGLLFAEHVQGGGKLTGIDETLGGGGCALDYDGDGSLDLFLVGGSGQNRYFGRAEWWQRKRGNRLYRNRGDGTFLDATEAAGLADANWGMGCTAADFDNDGDTDLLVTHRGPNRLYRNEGDGTFSDATAGSGLAGDRWTTSAAVADYDGDGRLDLYLVNYLEFDREARTYEKSTGFEPLLPITFNPALYDSQPNRLLRNLGGLRFEEVTEEAGVADPGGRGLAARWIDADGDRRPDLLVANDDGLPNRLFLNQGDGRFIDGAARWRIHTVRAAHGIAAGDLDGDGEAELLLTTAAPHPPLLYRRQGDEYLDHARRSGLDEGRGATVNGWGSALADLNNDGALDLLIAAGHPLPDHDGGKISQGEPNPLWLNAGDGRLRPAPAGSMPADALSSRGVVVGDFDNDGDHDLVITHNNDGVQYLRNASDGGHWLGLRLIGRTANRDALGTRVTVEAGGRRWSRRVDGRPTFLSSGDPRLLFQLGDAAETARITVQWPDGAPQTHTVTAVDRYLTLTQGADAPLPAPPAVTVAATAPPAPPFDEPAHRAEALRWLIERRGAEAAAPALAQLAADERPAARLAAVRLAADHPHPGGLRLLIDALEAEDADLRLAAVEGLRRYEEEASVRWLLRRFDDPSAKVRCALAGAFGHFFREEEAVVNRKYRALPHLARLTADPAPEVRRCAARALADAERYRALGPLTALLGDPVAAVRADAARALGLIRERGALPHLTATLADPAQPAEVIGQLLIAFKRLSHAESDALPARLLAQADDPRRLLAVLRALRDLMGDRGDGVTLRPDLIAGAVRGWFEATDDIPPEARATALEILAAAAPGAREPAPSAQPEEADPVETALRRWNRLHRATPWVKAPPPELERALDAALDASGAKLSDTALTLLTERREPWARQRLSALLLHSDHPLEMRHRLLERLAESGRKDAAPLLLRLARLLHDPLSVEATALLARFPSAEVERHLAATLNNPKRREAHRFAAARALYALAPERLMAALHPAPIEEIQ